MCAIITFMKWLLLIHQIPSKPTCFRAKIGRRLKHVGAIPIKKAAYVLPHTEQCLEDLSWIAKEIHDRGGEAISLDTTLLEGLTDKQVIHLFEKARRANYERILNEAKDLMSSYHSQKKNESLLSNSKTELRRLKRSFDTIVNIDFFPIPEKEKLGAYLDEIETIIHEKNESGTKQESIRNKYIGYTWVTKRNVYVDRIASAWFITRFVDSKASFKFIERTHYQPQKNELRFDMREAEYTHQEDRCTFEVFVQTFCPNDRGLKQIAKLIHDIDLKDDGYGLPETAGFQAVLDSIVATTSDDLKRIKLSSTIFDGLLLNYTNKI